MMVVSGVRERSWGGVQWVVEFDEEVRASEGEDVAEVVVSCREVL